VLILNVSALIFVFVVTEEKFFIINSRHGVINAADTWGLFIPVVAMFLGRRMWISILFFLALLCMTGSFSNEVWLIKTGTHNPYPLNIYFMESIIFLAALVCLAFLAVGAIVRRVLPRAGQANRAPNEKARRASLFG
jgi:hypothetical protein